MPKQIIITTENDLLNGNNNPLINHKFIIEEVLTQLQTNGLEIEKKVYSKNLNGDIVSADYFIKDESDSELGLLISWTNSYEKSAKFKFIIGGYNKVDNTIYISHDDIEYCKISNLNIAKENVKNYIELQLSKSNEKLKEITSDRELMKKENLSEYEISAIMGLLYFKESIITISQIADIKKKYSNENDLCSFYDLISSSLSTSHPKFKIKQYKDLHFIMKGLISEEENMEAQLSILEQEDSKEEITVTAFDGHLKIENKIDELPDIPKELPIYEREINEENIINKISCNPVLIGENTSVISNNNIFFEETEDRKLVEEKLLNEVEEDIILSSELEDSLTKLDLGEKPICLEEQIAGEYVAEITEEELEISSPPIVNEPNIVDNDAVDFDPQPIKKEEDKKSNPFIY